MKNCLVTKLKASVQNENLSVLGSWKFKINVPSNYGDDQYYNRLAIVGYEPFTITASNSKNIWTYGGGSTGHEKLENLGSVVAARKSGDVWSQNICFPETGEYYITINSKYNIYRLDNIPETAFVFSSDFIWIPLTELNITNASSNYDIKLNDLPSTLTLLKITTSDGRMKYTVTGSTEDLSKLTKLTTFTLSAIPIEGNIASLGKLKLLNSISIEATNIYGNLEDFVRQMVAGPNAVTTGIINVVKINNNLKPIKFNNIEINNNSSTTLSWEPATAGQTSVTFNDTTIVIDN